MKRLPLAIVAAASLFASTAHAQDQPGEQPEPSRFRARAGLGAAVDVVYGAPVYTGGVEVGLGSRVHPEWLVYATFRYQGGQTNHGLDLHDAVVGAAFVYDPGRFRLGLEGELAHTVLLPFTHDDVYWGLGGGAKVTLGVDLIDADDGALFLEARSGVRRSTLFDEATFTPVSIWLGGRWGP